ncbi:hypothetical protein SAMN05444397_101474 [Flavobacterium aquidurense]|uniref:DUF3592 domain-containing protein n=1 Tax=Flavobacterium frigidimaris TaxID=262320 RepID=A0ABX4BL05_FLAFR|nr:hypothetical protein [Flavobacterium frigidimaris]OXA76040.1 hypothetical protein B0A65_19475 [Flavobacterium frigidimaris]SDY37261.1 hypothetical protein SAMN05444397_101474 [Flavobacterium aquidurense]
MDSNHEAQLNQIKKIFFGPFLLVIALILFFIASYFIKLEYDEHVRYGQIMTGKVVDTYWVSSGDSPPTSLFYCIISVGTKNYTFEIQNAEQDFMLSHEEQNLIKEVKNGDQVKVKLLSNKTAKIVEWKKIKINPKNKFTDILGMWLTIILLFSITGYLLYKIYCIYRNKT